MTVTEARPRIARWTSVRRHMPDESRVLVSTGTSRNVAIGAYYPDSGEWVCYVRSRGYQRFGTPEEARARVERLAAAKGWTVESAAAMTPTEALALLASVDDPHVVEAGRVLARLLPEYGRWFDEGRDAERAAVVAWLRSEDPGSPADVWGGAVGGNEWTTAADAIERGAHREGE